MVSIIISTLYMFYMFTFSSICMNPSMPQGFVSSGEDGAVRVWAAGDCVREIRLPAHSVWSITCLDNGDIVTGNLMLYIYYIIAYT